MIPSPWHKALNWTKLDCWKTVVAFRILTQPKCTRVARKSFWNSSERKTLFFLKHQVACKIVSPDAMIFFEFCIQVRSLNWWPKADNYPLVGKHAATPSLHFRGMMVTVRSTLHCLFRLFSVVNLPPCNGHSGGDKAASQEIFLSIPIT